MRVLGGAEQAAEQRDVAEQWHLGFAARHVVLDQSAEHHHLAVLGKDGALDGALVGDQVDRPRGQAGARGDGGDFLLDLQAQGGALVDVRGDLEGNADILPLDGGERIAGAGGIGGVGTGLERHVLADEDFRALVVQGQQAGRGQQVALAVRRQRGDQRAEAVGAQADDGAVRQVFRHAFILQALQQGADRQAGVGEVHPAEPAGAATRIDGPLHAQGVGDVAGHLDNRRLHQYLGARHIELAHDVLQRVHRFRLGQQDQRVEAFIGADQHVLRAAGRRGAAAFRAGQARRQFAEGGGQGLGIVVAQANHPGVGRTHAGCVQRPGHGGQLGACRRRAEQDQAVGAPIGDHLGAAGAAGLAPGDGGVEGFRRVHYPGVPQVEHAVVLLVLLVQLADQLLQAGDVGAPVADDQRVAAGHGRQVAVLRHQRADQRQQLAGGVVLHLDQAGLQLIGQRRRRAGFGLGVGVGHDARLVTLGDDGEAVGGHHREKQLVGLPARQARLGDHAHLALDAWVDDEGFSGDLRHLVDELADVGILEVDGPVFGGLAIRDGGCLGHGGQGKERSQQQAGQA